MTKDEFETHVNRAIQMLGEEAVLFFIIVKKMEEYFIKSDEAFMGSPLLAEEINEIGHDIVDVLGQEDGKRFFKAVYDTLPTQTVYYLSILLKLAELGGEPVPRA
jgi:hypothetical protein